MINLSRSRFAPYDHQRLGVEALVSLVEPERDRTIPGCFALFDEMGAGKSKQVIDAAQVLYEQREINRVVIIAPASVRTVWFDPELGELKKHLWEGLPAIIQEFHQKLRSWNQHVDNPVTALHFIVTNYEFIRAKARLEQLKPFVTRKTLLVLDEASAVKSHRAEQTKACLQLRRGVTRVVLLNGTPIANNPLDLYSQGNLLDHRIIGCQNFFHFRARYAIMGGFLNKQILSWQNLEDLQKRFAPYVLRRLKSDCLDLPEKLPPTTLTVTLTDKTWKLYRDMRDQMIAWLDAQTVAVAPQAGVKAMRLAQLCSGFLGGVQDADDTELGVPEPSDDPTRPDWVPLLDSPKHDTTQLWTPQPNPVDTNLNGRGDLFEGEPETREVGREKLDAFLTWLDQRLVEDPNLKLLTWCRFRAEVRRLHDELKRIFQDNIELGLIWGGQKKQERQDSLRLLDPRTTPTGPVIVVGTPASGSMGLNLAASNTVIYVSNDFSLKTRQQSEDRVHRPGQTRKVSYTDVIAQGPTGQKTVDHLVIKALRAKENLASWTCAAWVKALREE